MKQIEITTELMEDLNNAIQKLKNLGFSNIRESDIFDTYMTQVKNELSINNIQKVLSNSVLLRYLNVNNQEFKTLTYKNKIYDSNNIVISEEKINVPCTDLDAAKKLFESLKFEELICVKYHVIVMAKGELEYAFQIVDGLGTLIEYESLEDFNDKTNDDVVNTKKEMLNSLKEFGIIVSNDFDIKKAWNLIISKYNLI